MPVAKYIGRNGNFAEAKVWQTWMASTASIAKRYRENDWYKEAGTARVYNDPFCYNEAASISILVAAAERSNFCAMAEYVTLKRHKKGCNWNDANGRADLWLTDCNTLDWEFEFKQPNPSYCSVYRPNTLEKIMEKARKNAKALVTKGEILSERMGVVAGCIFHPSKLHDDRFKSETGKAKFDKLEENLTKMCRKPNHDPDGTRHWIRHGWKISPAPKTTPTFFVFDVLK